MSDMEIGTMMYKFAGKEDSRARRILVQVFQALQEKGYNPVTQLVGYLMSGDPTYITSHKDARNLIRRVDRDELLEELVAGYLQAGESNR